MLPLLAFFAFQQAQGPTPYWQQRVVYQINARLDEPTFTLRGDQRVRYINHSPDTLRTIAFHLYLNAFRPGSRWSDADSAEGRRRFNDLKDPDYGSNHVRNVRIDGVAVQPIWPLAPDSTIVRFTLPKALAPGDSTDITMDWDARPSTGRGDRDGVAVVRLRAVVSQGRSVRHVRLGGARALSGGGVLRRVRRFFVRLDVPKLSGGGGCDRSSHLRRSRLECCESGRRPAREQQRLRPRQRQGVLAGYIMGSPRLCTAHGSTVHATRDTVDGRKQILWVARDVHNFAMSMSPRLSLRRRRVERTPGPRPLPAR